MISVAPPPSVNVPMSVLLEFSIDTNLFVVPELCTLTCVAEEKFEPLPELIPHAFLMLKL